MSPRFELQQAQRDDAQAVHALLDDAARWLQTRGIDQWKPGAFPLALVERGIVAGHVWVARVGRELAGTLTLQPGDQNAWPDDPPGEALYLHRLVIKRSFAGAGLGLALLRAAESVAVERGVQFLRLDCVASNERLRRYYQEAGYSSRGDVEFQDAVRLSRFEKALRRML